MTTYYIMKKEHKKECSILGEDKIGQWIWTMGGSIYGTAENVLNKKQFENLKKGIPPQKHDRILS